MAEDESKPILSGRQRRCRTVLKVLVNILLPWLLFCTIYGCTAFWLHQYYPNITWGIVLASWGFVVVTTLGYQAAARKGRRQDAIWGLFMTLSLAIAIVLGTYFGNRHFQLYWRPFYDFAALEAYVNINPNKDNGVSFMDAGQVYFKEGSHVDLTRVVAFKNYDVYCVAPIIRQVLEEEGKRHKTGGSPVELPESGTIDFFAVGVNCCDPTGDKFTCGDVTNGKARSGLRVLQADHRPFYNMAVTMWSSKYDLPAKHPLFFEWLVDPLAKVGGLELAGTAAYFNSYVTFGVWCSCIVILFICVLDVAK